MTKKPAAVISVEKAEIELATAEERLAIVVEERLQAEIKTQVAQLELAEKERKAREDELSDASNFHHFLHGTIDSSVARKVVRKLNQWSRAEPETVTITICSNGGACSAGFAIIDAILGLRDQGIEVNGVVRGIAQSMGAYVLQACDERVIGRNSSLLIHEGSIGVHDSVQGVHDTMQYMKIWNERMLDLLEERATISREEIIAGWHRTDWFIDAPEALKLGFVDRIG